MTSIRIGLRLASSRIAAEANVHRLFVVFLTTTDWPLLALSIGSCQSEGVVL